MEIDTHYGNWYKVTIGYETFFVVESAGVQPEWDEYELIENQYGVRLTMPGHLDATDWRIAEDPVEVVREAAELIDPDGEGEPETGKGAAIQYVNLRRVTAERTFNFAERADEIHDEWHLSEDLKEACDEASSRENWEEVCRDVLVG